MSTSTWTNRLRKDDYKRPPQTYTDKLSREDVVDKLNGYKKVDDIIKVPLGTHLRYFKKLETGKDKFCMGGFLHKNTGIPNYVILKNDKSSWTVQLNTATFFRKMSNTEIMDEYEDKLDELQKKYDSQKSLNKELKKENKTLQKEIDYYKHKNKN